MDTKKNKTAKQALLELHLALAKTADSLQELQYRLDKQGQARAENMVDHIIAQASNHVSETA